MNVSTTTISSARPDSAVTSESRPAHITYATKVDEYLRCCRECSRELVAAVQGQLPGTYFEIEVPRLAIQSGIELTLTEPGEIVTWFVGDSDEFAVLQLSPAGKRANQWVANCNRHLDWCRYRFAELAAESGWKK